MRVLLHPQRNSSIWMSSLFSPRGKLGAARISMPSVLARTVGFDHSELSHELAAQSLSSRNMQCTLLLSEQPRCLVNVPLTILWATSFIPRIVTMPSLLISHTTFSGSFLLESISFYPRYLIIQGLFLLLSHVLSCSNALRNSVLLLVSILFFLFSLSP